MYRKDCVIVDGCVCHMLTVCRCMECGPGIVIQLLFLG